MKIAFLFCIIVLQSNYVYMLLVKDLLHFKYNKKSQELLFLEIWTFFLVFYALKQKICGVLYLVCSYFLDHILLFYTFYTFTNHICICFSNLPKLNEHV